MQVRAEQAEALRDEQSAQVEEASSTINKWQQAYEQLNQQLKEAQASPLCPCMIYLSFPRTNSHDIHANVYFLTELNNTSCLIYLLE